MLLFLKKQNLENNYKWILLIILYKYADVKW